MDRTDTFDFIKCAEECRMGDPDAMLKMHTYLRERLSDKCKDIERQCILNKDPRALIKYIVENRDDRNFLLGANMWLLRAAICKDPEAKKIADSDPYHEKFSLINSDGRVRGTRYLIDIGLTGAEFKEIGIDGFAASKEYSLRHRNERGYYMASSYAGYDGPDSTGFGMEEEYDFIFFDEFFNICCTRKAWPFRDIWNDMTRICDEADKVRAAEAAQREAYRNNIK